MAKRSWLRTGIIVSGAAAAGFGVWVFTRDGGSPRTPSSVASSTTQLSGRNLRALSKQIDLPFYWAGPRDNVTYEFTETADRRVYVRYLPAGVAAGSATPYLTVASYPVADAYAVTRTAAHKPGAVALDDGGQGVAFYTRARPTNAYLAFPRANVQIELYDPSPQALRELVASGRIQPVSESTPGVAVQTKAAPTTPAALSALAGKLGHPIFWLGRIPETTLELSRSPDGRVYLRYLPAGVAAGTAKPYLTVATYPLAGAAATTASSAHEPGAVRIQLPGAAAAGAVAFFNKARPTNVYIAQAGSNEQVEVFDPSAAHAHELVAGGKVQPVP